MRVFLNTQLKTLKKTEPAGAVVEVDDDAGEELIATGAAQAVTEPDAKKSEKK
jgi:hypothetical protein